jgi:hypothetical protein
MKPGGGSLLCTWPLHPILNLFNPVRQIGVQITVGITLDYGLYSQILIPVNFSTPQHPVQLRARPASFRGFFQGANQPGHEAEHSHLCSA